MMEQVLEVGSELTGEPKRISLQTMRRYSGTSGIHAQDDDAKDQGLGGALVQGGQLTAYLNHMMTSHFGEAYLSGGNIAVSFIKPGRNGDVLTPKGIVKEEQPEGERVRLVCEVWLENQNGDKVTVGTASSLRRK